MRVHIRVRLDWAGGGCEVQHVELPAHRYLTLDLGGRDVLGVHVNLEEVDDDGAGEDCGCGNGPMCPLYSPRL